MVIGWIVGLIMLDPDNPGLYAVSVVFLLQVSDYLQWFLRQMIIMESLLVSVERAQALTKLNSEK